MATWMKLEVYFNIKIYFVEMFLDCGLAGDLAPSISEHWNCVRGHWYITTICIFQHIHKRNPP